MQPARMVEMGCYRTACHQSGTANGIRREQGLRKKYKNYEYSTQRIESAIVDAFTDRPFSGNPAAVCVMDRWPPDASMRKLAMENNLSETAFVVKEDRAFAEKL